MLGYIIGIGIGGIIYIIVNACTEMMYTSDWCAKKLSKDKPFQRFRGGYVIYANGSRWFYYNHAGVKLVWIPTSLGDDLNTLIENESLIDYQCTWLSQSKMFKDVKTIINIHPNLTPPNLYWKIIKFLQ